MVEMCDEHNNNNTVILTLVCERNERKIIMILASKYSKFGKEWYIYNHWHDLNQVIYSKFLERLR